MKRWFGRTQKVQKNRVYFDSSSTTNVHPEVLKTYETLLETYYVNSESLYDEGSEIHRMMEKARNAIAGLLGVSSQEILFTAGASEANNAAIKGVCFANQEKKHIITTQIEHSSVLNCCRQLEEHFGYAVTYLPVNEKGVVRVEDVKDALRKDTALVSIMHVNNEVGSINPINDIKEIIKKQSQAYFHVDLTQSFSKVPLDLKDIDLASLSAHKIEGLKGSGLLVKKRHVPFLPLICGGEQEFGLRGGTSNALVNMVLAKTMRLALEEHKTYQAHIQLLKEELLSGLKGIEGIQINSSEEGISEIVNFSYPNIPSEIMQNALNEKGYLVSARSTCESKSHNPSYVLLAMGYNEAIANSCIRISLSKHNTIEEVHGFIDALKEIIASYGKRI